MLFHAIQPLSGALGGPLIEPAHDKNKTYNKTCVTNRHSDQPVHPPGMAWNFVNPALNSPEAIESTGDQ